MPPIPVVPRRLTSSERSVLEHILEVGFDGASALRGQLDQVEVVAIWSARSSSVDLRVREPFERASLPTGLVPVDAQVLDARGDYIGELLVWTEDGALAGLEYAWVTDEMPECLPSVESIQITLHQERG